MKYYKEFINEMSEEMTDAEVSFYPEKVKTDKSGKVTSYDIRVVFTSKHSNLTFTDSTIKRAFISWMGDSKIKQDLSRNAVAALYHTEVYSAVSNKGVDIYIYFGNKKVPVKLLG